MMMVELLEEAKKQMANVTGLNPVTAMRAFKDDEGWHVGVEMLEMTRIPTSTDLLGYYDLLLSEDGNLLRFERRGTRLRGEPRDEGSA